MIILRRISMSEKWNIVFLIYVVKDRKINDPMQIYSFLNDFADRLLFFFLLRYYFEIFLLIFVPYPMIEKFLEGTNFRPLRRMET